MDERIKVGAEVILRSIRYNGKTRPDDIKGIIIKVGRLYYYVKSERYDNLKFEVGDESKRDNDYNWMLFFSEQDIINFERKEYLMGKFTELFRSYRTPNWTLAQLEAMAKIAGLEEGKDAK